MKKIPIALAVGLIVAGGLSASAQLALQYQSVNYDAVSGVWMDSSGNHNDAQFVNGATPTVDTKYAADMSAFKAVNIVGANASYGVGSHFQLDSALSATSGYTVFAVIASTRPTGSRSAITGGSNGGALEWDFYGGHDDFLQEYQADVGHGTATITTDGTLNLIDLAVNSSSYSFKFNGSADGSGTGVSFGNPITEIGNNEGGGDYFSGDIAEIDIYQGVLTSDQIAAVEATLTGEYIDGGIIPTPIPEPTTLAMLAGGFGLLFAARRFRK